MKWVADRTEEFLCVAHAATMSPTRKWRWTRTARCWASACIRSANLGAYLSTFASSVPTYLYAPLLSGQYNVPAIYCEVDAIYTNTAPVDAYRGAGRPEATFVVERLMEIAGARARRGSGGVPHQEFRHAVPAPDAGDHDYDAGDYSGGDAKGLAQHDYAGFPARKG